MAYSTLSDIELELDRDTLVQLTDDQGAGTVDTDKVARAIADADAMIDAYLAGRYTTPLSPVPDMIRQVSVALAVHHLYLRRDHVAPSEVRLQRHKDAVRFLELVAAGKVTLGAAQPAPDGDGGPQASTDKSDRVYTRGSGGTLEDY